MIVILLDGDDDDDDDHHHDYSYGFSSDLGLKHLCWFCHFSWFCKFRLDLHKLGCRS